MSTYDLEPFYAEQELFDEIREGIIDGTLTPATRDDCIVCDDLGNIECPHLQEAGAWHTS